MNPLRALTIALALWVGPSSQGSEAKSFVRQALYERTALALANFNLPNFTGVNRNLVLDSFDEIFTDDSKLKARWLAALQKRVRELSQGQVTLRHPLPEDRPPRFFGRIACLVLQRGSERKLVLIQPSPTPVTFWTQP